MAKRVGLNDSKAAEGLQRPRDLIFQPTTTQVEEQNPEEEFQRATFFVNKLIIEAIRVQAFKEHKQKSVLVRELFLSALDPECVDEAKENLKNLNK